MATINDLAKQVMIELGRLSSGEDPSAEELADIRTRYEQRLVMLADDNYADWDASDIPAVAMPGLVRVIAYEVAPMFGVARQTLVEANGDTWEDRGLAMLRRYMRQKPSYEPTPMDYF